MAQIDYTKVGNILETLALSDLGMGTISRAFPPLSNQKLESKLLAGGDDFDRFDPQNHASEKSKLI